MIEEGIARPILLGSPERIREHAERLGITSKARPLVDPRDSDQLDSYVGRATGKSASAGA